MTFSAVLLAGGNSSRMGRDKATLVVDGEPLWQRQLATLRQLDPSSLFVSAREPLAWRPADTQLLLDRSPSRGPISGIGAALSQMETSHLVVLAIDMPLMTAKQLRRLWNKVAIGVGAAPVIGNRFEPLGAIYPKEARPKFQAALLANDWSLQHLVTSLADDGLIAAISIDENEARRFRNINTPADLAPGLRA